jgi:uncharacterized membrane protein
MDLSKSGFWYMILCWVSAIGGIVTAILWAASKRRPPVDEEVLRKSLERRLKSGEISRAEYEKRLEVLRREQVRQPDPACNRKPPP